MQDKHTKQQLVKHTDYLKQKSKRNYLNISTEELKKLDFNKSEYDYFVGNCNFSERQKEILDLRRKGKSIVAISIETYLSERTINREIKKIKHKIYKLI